MNVENVTNAFVNRALRLVESSKKVEHTKFDSDEEEKDRLNKTLEALASKNLPLDNMTIDMTKAILAKTISDSQKVDEMPPYACTVLEGEKRVLSRFDSKEALELPFDITAQLVDLIVNDHEGFDILAEVLNRTYLDSEIPIKYSTLKNFITAITDKNVRPLVKNALDNNVWFNIIDYMDTSNFNEAQLQDKKLWQITNFQYSFMNKKAKDTIDSLPHELGHAFDFTNNAQTLGLTFDKIPDIKKDDSGNYVIDRTAVLPNTTKKGVPVFCENISFSREFENAFLKDYIRILELEEAQGLKSGSVFDSFLHDEKVSYYFGVEKINQESSEFKKDKLSKELFAQLAAYATVGKTTKPEFDELIEKYLPNTLEFVKSLLLNE